MGGSQRRVLPVSVVGVIVHLYRAHYIKFHQGWDSSAFTRISVEQKLKSVVDDDHFRWEKNQEQQKQI